MTSRIRKPAAVASLPLVAAPPPPAAAAAPAPASRLVAVGAKAAKAAPAPAPAAAVKPAATAVVVQSPPAAPAARPVPKNAQKISPRQRNILFVNHMMRRIANIRRRVRLYECVVPADGVQRDAFQGVREGLDRMLADGRFTLAHLETVPENWRAGGKRSLTAAGQDRVAPGARVNVRPKHLAAYAELLEPGEMQNLTVVAIKGGKASLRTAAGGRVLLPRAHVELAPLPAAAESSNGLISALTDPAQDSSLDISDADEDAFDAAQERAEFAANRDDD